MTSTKQDAKIEHVLSPEHARALEENAKRNAALDEAGPEKGHAVVYRDVAGRLDTHPTSGFPMHVHNKLFGHAPEGETEDEHDVRVLGEDAAAPLIEARRAERERLARQQAEREAAERAATEPAPSAGEESKQDEQSADRETATGPAHDTEASVGEVVESGTPAAAVDHGETESGRE